METSLDLFRYRRLPRSSVGVENAIEEVLSWAGISFRKTKRAEKLLVLQVAGSAHMDNQIIHTVLARFHQPGKRLRAQDRME